MSREKIGYTQGIEELCFNTFPNREGCAPTQGQDMQKQSKKQTERSLFAPFGFNAGCLTGADKAWLLSIAPNLRGCTLAKYYSHRITSHNPSSYWINQQVAKACKWIRKQEYHREKVLQKKLAKITFEDIIGETCTTIAES